MSSRSPLAAKNYPSRVGRIAGVILAFCIGLTAYGADRPNILWITSEDHGTEMGCYGNRLARTPNLDALALRGMMFERVWSIAPDCAPSRSTIMTGMYPASTGCIHMRSMVPMPSGAKMFPQLLREVGYYCVNNAKEDYNFPKPDGLWDESSARAHWRGRVADQPFFAIFNSTKTHESQISSRPHQAVTNPTLVRLPLYHPEHPDVRQDWAQYYDKVSEADADAGLLIKQLYEDGLIDETIIFYFTDHGSGMPRSKGWPCNSGLQVPLIVYFPDKWRHLAPKEYRPARRSDRLISSVDMAPTALSMAGIEPPPMMQGYAFAGQYQEDSPQFLFGERGRIDERYDVVRSVTDGRHVYIRNYCPHLSQGQHVDSQFKIATTRLWRDNFDRGLANNEQSMFWETPKAPEELYDLKHDRDEVTNLVAQDGYKDVLETMREIHRFHMLRTRDLGFLPEGELHSRSRESTPYDIAFDDEKYPFERILETAELASDNSPGAAPQLIQRLSDKDSTVRYWSALGFLIRGSMTINSAKPALKKALEDSSPYVRLIAAQTLIDYGTATERKPSLEVIDKLISPTANDVFISMAALNSIDALGRKALPLIGSIRTMSPKGKSPDGRYDSNIPRLIEHILSSDWAMREAESEEAKQPMSAKK